MATIVPYRQQTSSVVGAPDTRRGTLRVDSSNPLAGVAQGIETYRQREAQAEVGKVQRILAEKQAKWTVELANRKLDTNWGDQDFQSKFMEDYRADMDQLYGSTSSREATEFLNTNAAKLGASFLTDSGVAQASRLGKHALDNAIATQDAITETILAEPNKVFSLWKQYEKDVQGPNSPFQGTGVNIDKALEEAKNSMFAAHIQGLLNNGYSPTKLKNSLKNGDYSDYLTSDTAQKFIQAAETYEGKARAAAARQLALNNAARDKHDADMFTEGMGMVARNEQIPIEWYEKNNVGGRVMAALMSQERQQRSGTTDPVAARFREEGNALLAGGVPYARGLTNAAIADMGLEVHQADALMARRDSLLEDNTPTQTEKDAAVEAKYNNRLLTGGTFTNAELAGEDASARSKAWLKARRDAALEKGGTPDEAFRQMWLKEIKLGNDKVLTEGYILGANVSTATKDWMFTSAKRFEGNDIEAEKRLRIQINSDRPPTQADLDNALITPGKKGGISLEAHERLSSQLAAKKPKSDPYFVIDTEALMTPGPNGEPPEISTVNDLIVHLQANNITDPNLISVLSSKLAGKTSSTPGGKAFNNIEKNSAATSKASILARTFVGSKLDLPPHPDAVKDYTGYLIEMEELRKQAVDMTPEEVGRLFESGGKVEQIRLRYTSTLEERAQRDAEMMGDAVGPAGTIGGSEAIPNSIKKALGDDARIRVNTKSGVMFYSNAAGTKHMVLDAAENPVEYIVKRSK